MTDREVLAKYLTGAADYHERTGTHVVVAAQTLKQIRALGALLEPPINTRQPGAMYPATARRYAAQLRAKEREVAA